MPAKPTPRAIGVSLLRVAVHEDVLHFFFHEEHSKPKPIRWALQFAL
ncbi:MAG: hypothetical protein QXR53_01735 [Candidatus Norongarragalinales archaeon]